MQEKTDAALSKTCVEKEKSVTCLKERKVLNKIVKKSYFGADQSRAIDEMRARTRKYTEEIGH